MTHVAFNSQYTPSKNIIITLRMTKELLYRNKMEYRKISNRKHIFLTLILRDILNLKLITLKFFSPLLSDRRCCVLKSSNFIINLVFSLYTYKNT